jgi:hypothetical protein
MVTPEGAYGYSKHQNEIRVRHHMIAVSALATDSAEYFVVGMGDVGIVRTLARRCVFVEHV